MRILLVVIAFWIISTGFSFAQESQATGSLLPLWNCLLLKAVPIARRQMNC